MRQAPSSLRGEPRWWPCLLVDPAWCRPGSSERLARGARFQGTTVVIVSYFIPKPHCPIAYLGLDVVERGRADDREADQENIGLWIRQGAQSIVILLSCSIPQSQADGPAIDHHTC